MTQPDTGWSTFHAKCPSCHSGPNGYWYHPGGDKCYFVSSIPNKGYIVQTNGNLIRCDGCKAAKNISTWKFKCGNHDFQPFKFDIIIHCEAQNFTHTLPSNCDSWNNNHYLKIIELINTKFNPKGQIELYEICNGNKEEIDDMDDIKSSFQHLSDTALNLYVKLTRFQLKYNKNSFCWSPPIYVKSSNDNDDEKQWDKNYESLLNKINESFKIDIIDIKLEVENKTDSVLLDNGNELMSQWNLIANDEQANESTKAITVSKIEQMNEHLPSINNKALNGKTIDKRVIEQILGENSKSLIETKNMLSKIEAAVSMKKDDEKINEIDNDEKKFESEQHDEKSTDEFSVAMKDDIVDETDELFASTKDDLMGVITTQCHIQQTIYLLQEILKYKPKNKSSKQNTECKKLWSIIHKCAQNTINDMNNILNMKKEYINNMKNIGNFIKDINSADDMDQLHIKIDNMIKLQSNYDNKIQESTDNALNILKSVMEKFIDPSIIEQTKNNIKKYRKLSIRSQIEYNKLQKKRSSEISPIIESIREIKLLISSLRYRKYENKRKLGWIENLINQRKNWERAVQEAPEPTAYLSSNLSEAAPNETIVFDMTECRDCQFDPPVKYMIDFGDGTKLTKSVDEHDYDHYYSNRKNYFGYVHKNYEHHNYKSPGNYVISLTIWDKFGKQKTTQMSQKICNNPYRPVKLRYLHLKIKQYDKNMLTTLNPYANVFQKHFFQNNKFLFYESKTKHYYSASVSLKNIKNGYITCTLFDNITDESRIWEYFNTGKHIDVNQIFLSIGYINQKYQYKLSPSFNNGIYGSYCSFEFHKYRASLNNGIYGNYVIKTFIDVFEVKKRIFDILDALDIKNCLWSNEPNIEYYYCPIGSDFGKWDEWKRWKEQHPNEVLEDIQSALHKTGGNLKSEIIKNDLKLIQLQQKLTQSKNYWRNKIHEQIKNVNENKQKFEASSNDMNNMIKRTGVKQRDIYDFLSLTKNLVPIMIKDQQSTNSLSTQFTLSYDLIKRNLGPKRNAYEVKLYLQNSQQYIDKLEPYIIKLNDNKFIYMKDIQCKTKNEYNDKIFNVLLTVNNQHDEKELSETTKHEINAEKLLQSWGLSKYVEIMKQKGNDNPLKWSNLDDKYLKTTLNFKPGHIKKFKRKIQEWLDNKIPITIKRKFESLCVDNKEWEQYYQQSTVIVLNKQKELKNRYLVFNKIW